MPADPDGFRNGSKSLRRRLGGSPGRLIRHPLLHFFLLGGLVFLWLGEQDSFKVQIQPTVIESGRRALAASLDVAQLNEERRIEADRRTLDDELLYTEALRLGLDENDHIVRQRLIQKLLFLGEVMAGANPSADDSSLRDYFRRTALRWQHPVRVVLEHVYVRGEDREPLARALADLAGSDAHSGLWLELGDSFAGSRRVVASNEELAREFGDDFARQVASAPIGRWVGPVSSRYGLHLVRVRERREARPMTLEEDGPWIAASLRRERRQQARERLLRALYEKYEVEVVGAKNAQDSASVDLYRAQIDQVLGTAADAPDGHG